MSFNSKNTHEEDNNGMFVVWFLKKLRATLKWPLKNLNSVSILCIS